MDFSKFSLAVEAKFRDMVQKSNGAVYEANIDGRELSDFYLDSWPAEHNKIFRVRREHDCSCCKNFIRNLGKVVAIIDNKLTSVWEISVDEPVYQAMADLMAKKVLDSGIKGVYYSAENHYGSKPTADKEADILWKHFYAEVPAALKKRKSDIPRLVGDINESYGVFKRSVTEITKDAIDTVIELIQQNALYRGEEHKKTVQLLQKLQSGYGKAKDKELYLWVETQKNGHAVRIRNTVIGTLLTDLSEGRDLEATVKSFEQKVAPHNYKRPTALITQSMIKKAQEKVEELGIEEALHRRFAVTEDLSVNNVLFASRKSNAVMKGGVFDDLNPTKTVKPNLDRMEEVSIKDFVDNYLPLAETLEVYVENSHKGNMMSLIAPQSHCAKNIFKWGNNFSWSYNGDITDSMKERVKSAGGNVDGCLRFSIQWNEDGENRNDLDAHCIEPSGNRIYFGNKTRHNSSGSLDVDIIHPKSDQVAVENIIYTDINRMPPGNYQLLVHNYSNRGGKGFTAEVEFGGNVLSFSYDKSMRSGEFVKVAVVNLDSKGNFTVKESLPSSTSSKEIWGIQTQNFVPVKMVMNSPNHWDGEETGNKHVFFILEDCINPETTRGFYNEFLNSELEEHRKVFEVLGSKMKVEYSENQLSGVGFSSTQRNHVVCKVSGKFNRVVKIKF